MVAEATLERIPVFVRAGSIVPMIEAMQYVDEVRDAPIQLHVYGGADATFALYEDAGDGYAYEPGECALVRMRWDEARRELIVGSREGTFPEIVRERRMTVVLHSPEGERRSEFVYCGVEQRFSFDEEAQ